MANVLECPVCYEKYDDELHLPITLACGHTICDMCLNELFRQANRAAENENVEVVGHFQVNTMEVNELWSLFNSTYLYGAQCAVCRRFSIGNTLFNPSYSLLEVIEHLKANQIIECSDCGKKHVKDSMVVCRTCHFEKRSKAPAPICELCAFKEHKGHVISTVKATEEAHQVETDDEN